LMLVAATMSGVLRLLLIPDISLRASLGLWAVSCSCLSRSCRDALLQGKHKQQQSDRACATSCKVPRAGRY
jgi:hypothetical protein